MTPGFLGTGSIASAMVRGLCTAAEPPARILVSPRSADKAAALARDFPAVVEVAADNQAVVDGADCVVLSVLPPQLPEVAGALRFRAGQPVLSCVALVPLAEVVTLVAPAGPVVRAVPLPSSARQLGPIAYFPEEDFAAALLRRIGTPVATGGEAEFHALWTLTALIAPYFEVLEHARHWAAGRGVADAAAKAYSASMAQALAVLAVEHEGTDFSALIAEAMTPGGLNEQTRRELGEAGAFAAFPDALERIYRRLDG